MSDVSFAFAPIVTTVPIEDSGDRYPVRRIYCVGRNYADHIREMGGDERDPPFFFQKPTDSIVQDKATVAYPTFTEDFQHEIELVLAIGLEGSDIAEADVAKHVFGTAVGIDLTRRDVQVVARKTGRPWEIGKSFDHSAPISALRPLDGRPIPTAGEISLSVNGEVRQKGDLAEMIWNSMEIVSQLSRQYRLLPGDLIYTGTPAGVGPLLPGDQVHGSVEGIGQIDITIGERELA